MAAAAIPAAASIFSAYMGSRQSGAEKRALGAQTNALTQLSGQGGQLFGAGMPATKTALSYYDTLLRGSRGAMNQAVAGPTAQLTDVYRGAEKNLDRQGVRGGARDTAVAELGRDRANQIAGLTTGVQPMAAGALASMGTNLTGQATAPLATAAGGFGQMGAAATHNRQYSNQLWGQAGEGIGELLVHVLRGRSGGGGGGNPKPTGLPGQVPLPTMPR